MIDKYIIDCTYISEWDGEIEQIECIAQLDVSTGIISNIQENTTINPHELGPLLGQYTQFTFCNKDYRLYLVLSDTGYRVQQLEQLIPIRNMLQLQSELPMPTTPSKKVKI